MRRSLVLIVLMVLMVLMARPAEAAVGPFVGPQGGPKVAAVGDSLLGQLQSEGPRYPRSRQALTRTLVDEGWRALVETRNAWRTQRLRVLAREAVDRGARVVILSAASGDIRFVRRSADPIAAREAVRRAIRRTVAAFPGRCVVWPTVREWGIPKDRVTARMINRELDRADAASVSFRSPDWAAAARSHPEWFWTDGIHLSRRGEAAFQFRLLTAARACVAGLDP